MRTWYSTVILALNYKGGRSVDLQDIYSGIHRYRTLSDHDCEPHPKYQQENYKHTTRSVLAKLKKYGFVSNPYRAVYSLTEKSTKHLAAFETDRYGRSAGAEISVEELIERFALARESSAT
ncbi:hypothetical protein COMA2_150077 [Candidatus Nitrospira nitrificans]|uniref:Restriction system protein Mrr-like N-terminal domain-containing protein n=1 Tax=Candidatus Nitrospira nitrificans TaxID=1742973 RepID=A0A0S4LB80_9BACT|nr:hypothetical protein COMA2_150077 [Candidatus Nitrospira nitrificans]